MPFMLRGIDIDALKTGMRQRLKDELRKRVNRCITQDLCFVCLGDCPKGCYHAELGIRTHHPECSAVITKHSRDYSRSARGRWRSRFDVLKRVVKPEPTLSQHTQ